MLGESFYYTQENNIQFLSYSYHKYKINNIYQVAEMNKTYEIFYHGIFLLNTIKFLNNFVFAVRNSWVLS